jgi:4-hydroxy-3-polyprenylbenzoate decarboxylase
VTNNVCVAITGASGASYSFRLIECLLAAKCNVSIIVSKAALLVIATETTLRVPPKISAQEKYFRDYFSVDETQLNVYAIDNWFSPWASGSGTSGALVVCPCSMGTLASIATGMSDNLIERAADVALKERRKLVLVPRETPYSEVHLSNMLALTKMGAVILPASPGLYHNPKFISDLVDFVVSRILNQLNIPHVLMPLWGKMSKNYE